MADATTTTTVPGTKLILGSSSDKKGITISPSTVYYNGNIVKGIMDSDKTHLFWKNGIYNAVNEAIPKLTSNTSADDIIISCDSSNDPDVYPYYYTNFTKPYKFFTSENFIVSVPYKNDNTNGSNIRIKSVKINFSLRIQFPTQIIISKIRFQIPSISTGYTYQSYGSNNSDILFQGSNDNINYNTLIKINDYNTTEKYYENNNIKDSYLYYRLYLEYNNMYFNDSGYIYAKIGMNNIQFYTV